MIHSINIKSEIKALIQENATLLTAVAIPLIQIFIGLPLLQQLHISPGSSLLGLMSLVMFAGLGIMADALGFSASRKVAEGESRAKQLPLLLNVVTTITKYALACYLLF